MFHHFHDEKNHLKSQGSISKDDFYRLIKFIGKKNILNANIFYENLKKNKLKSNQVCFTFDDAIKSQIEVALPVLEDLKIKSFFFVYSSLFEGRPDNLEVFRFFRTNYFKSIDSFYDEFFKFVKHDLDKFFKLQNKNINLQKKQQPFYSLNDIKFRVVRDLLLKKKEYEKIMFEMIKKKKFNLQENYKKLFFNQEDLKKLDSLGHIIGLHSHDHPTLIEKLSYKEQNSQYTKCQSVISKILNKPVNNFKTMSHPCGSYNNETLKILTDLGIELGFKNIMEKKSKKKMKQINNLNLEIARINHTLIMKMLK
jgi:peptidoglycan/xylan/chitin deacetylase (PgdA/CDA1 family)